MGGQFESRINHNKRPSQWAATNNRPSKKPEHKTYLRFKVKSVHKCVLQNIFKQKWYKMAPRRDLKLTALVDLPIFRLDTLGKLTPKLALSHKGK